MGVGGRRGGREKGKGEGEGRGGRERWKGEVEGTVGRGGTARVSFKQFPREGESGSNSKGLSPAVELVSNGR